GKHRVGPRRRQRSRGYIIIEHDLDVAEAETLKIVEEGAAPAACPAVGGCPHGERFRAEFAWRRRRRQPSGDRLTYGVRPGRERVQCAAQERDGPAQAGPSCSSNEGAGPTFGCASLRLPYSCCCWRIEASRFRGDGANESGV